MTDARLDELRQMGLHVRWLRVAAAIGVDNFLTLWRLLDGDFPEGQSLMIPMPRFSRYMRYQRNRYILALVSDGMTPREIQKQVRSVLCENISIRHIERLTENHRKRCKLES